MEKEIKPICGHPDCKQEITNRYGFCDFHKPEERRVKFEVREMDDGEKKLIGTPIVYNKDSEDMGFIERISPGAATEALKKSDVRLLYGHNSDSLLPIARQSAGTLRATETKKGVDIEADPPKKNTFVDALIESIERGDVDDMSFGFTIAADEWKDLDTDHPIRTITKFERLYDFSYVTFPAYSDTTAGTDVRVAMRSLDAARNVKKEPETTPPFTLISVSALEEKSAGKIKVEVNGVEFAERKKTETPLAVSPLPAETKTVADPPKNPEIGNPEVNDLSFWRNAKAERIKKEKQK